MQILDKWIRTHMYIRQFCIPVRMFVSKKNASPYGRSRGRHCKENTVMYSRKGNCAASFPISTYKYLWAIYIFPRSVGHRQYMNVEIRTEAASFLSGNILFQFSVQCLCSGWYCMSCRLVFPEKPPSYQDMALCIRQLMEAGLLGGGGEVACLGYW